MLFPRQVNYSLFILLMESALVSCQNSLGAKHAMGKAGSICDAWVKESRFRTPKSKFSPVYDHIVNV